ncbi:MAG: leucine-rich repeat domain-containing protein [Clostridia bacterium]|nr:leucine-rich repeat domain-containing protein [Clostridia bacterium]
MGDGAFRGCSSLSSMTVGAGVTSINDDAFLNCGKLAIVTLPESVK